MFFASYIGASFAVVGAGVRDPLFFLFFETKLLLTLLAASVRSSPLEVTSSCFTSLLFLFLGSFSPSKKCLYNSSSSNLFFCFRINTSIFTSIVSDNSFSSLEVSISSPEKITPNVINEEDKRKNFSRITFTLGRISWDQV
jgi:hypothetical protein